MKIYSMYVVFICVFEPAQDNLIIVDIMVMYTYK